MIDLGAPIGKLISLMAAHQKTLEKGEQQFPFFIPFPFAEHECLKALYLMNVTLGRLGRRLHLWLACKYDTDIVFEPS